MRNLLILSLVFIFLPCNSFSQEEIVGELAEIKEDISIIKENQEAINSRIDNLERSVNNLQRSVNNLERSLNNLRPVVLIGFGILVIGMLVLIGFVLSDRRNALAIEELHQKQKTIERALRIFAMEEPKFKESMESAELI